jgi:hypothetical protein
MMRMGQDISLLSLFFARAKAIIASGFDVPN